MQRLWQVRTYFASSAVERFDLRARVRHDARVSFSPGIVGEPPLPSYPTSPTCEVLVVDQDPARGHRVLYDSPSARLLLWVHPGDCVDVITRPVLVHLDPQPQPLASDLFTGVELLPGCVVGVNEQRPVWTDVSGGDDHFRYRGWVPGQTVGAVYRDALPLPRLEPDLWIAPGTAVYDAPSGSMIGAFTKRAPHPARLLSARGHDTVAVRYQGNRFQVTGYVEQGNIRRDDSAWNGWAVGRGFSRDSVRLHLPRGTCLYACPGGELVGVTVEDTVEEVEGVHDGWWHIPALWTPWRGFDVWVEDDGPAECTVHSHDRVLYRKLQQCEV